MFSTTKPKFSGHNRSTAMEYPRKTASKVDLGYNTSIQSTSFSHKTSVSLWKKPLNTVVDADFVLDGAVHLSLKQEIRQKLRTTPSPLIPIIPRFSQVQFPFMTQFPPEIRHQIYENALAPPRCTFLTVTQLP